MHNLTFFRTSGSAQTCLSIVKVLFIASMLVGKAQN